MHCSDILLVTSFLLLFINESFGFQFSFLSPFVGIVNDNTLSRRSFGNKVVLTGLVTTSTLIQHESANAVWFEANDRRQLCLLALSICRSLANIR